jgi:hypothetical protein
MKIEPKKIKLATATSRDREQKASEKMHRAFAHTRPSPPPAPMHAGQPLQIGETCLLRRPDSWSDLIVGLRAIDDDVAFGADQRQLANRAARVAAQSTAMKRAVQVVQVVQVRGRPRCGSYRLETTLPRAALDELKRREEKTGMSSRENTSDAALCSMRL